MICSNLISDYLDLAEDDAEGPMTELKAVMKRGVQQAIANYAGEIYPGAYPLSDAYPNDLVFGTQSIDLGNFVDQLLAWVPVERLREVDDEEIPDFELGVLDDELFDDEVS